jgi:hypothetical protein
MTQMSDFRKNESNNNATNCKTSKRRLKCLKPLNARVVILREVAESISKKKQLKVNRNSQDLLLLRNVWIPASAGMAIAVFRFSPTQA